jgi:hypothetical protein
MKGTPQPRPSYRAPSWSWASIDGEVSGRGFYGNTRELEILDAVTYCDAAACPFSSVTGGFIVVQSHMREISHYVITSDYHVKFLGTTGRLDAIEPAISQAHDERPNIWILLGHESSGEKRSFGDIVDYSDGVGLILLENPGDQSFRRIGSFNDYDGQWDWVWKTSTARTIRIE